MKTSTMLTIPNDVARRMTFLDIERLDTGTQLWREDFSSGGAFLILRGSRGLVAYLGIPEAHPAAGASAEAFLDGSDCDVRVHGGFTFAEYGDGVFRSSGYYWFGWDYMHARDKRMEDSELRDLPPEALEPLRALEQQFQRIAGKQHPWTVDDVLNDSRAAVDAFKDALDRWRAGLSDHVEKEEI
jgi:hypothetical protein